MVSLVSLTDYGLLPPFQNIRSFSLLLTDIYLDAFVCRFTHFTSNLCTKRYLNICVSEKAKTYFGTEGVCLNGLSRSRGDGSSTIVIRTHHNLLPQRGDLYVVIPGFVEKLQVQMHPLFLWKLSCYFTWTIQMKSSTLCLSYFDVLKPPWSCASCEISRVQNGSVLLPHQRPNKSTATSRLRFLLKSSTSRECVVLAPGLIGALYFEHLKNVF
jgi:hypothetical protein